MKPKLALSLASNRLVLELVRPTPGPLRRQLAALLPGRGAPTKAELRLSLAKVAFAGELGIAQLNSRLELAIAELHVKHADPLAGLHLEVQLGLEHAHIGLTELQDVVATSLPASTREAYAQAWVTQMLHLDPATQIIRSQSLADAHKMLISCVDRAVFDVLQAFSQRHGLRFASCRPAVLSLLTGPRGAGNQSENALAALTVVWTEPGTETARGNCIQLLWRGWAPLVTEGPDAALEGALQRFQARHAAETGDVVKHLHWPSVVSDTVAVG
jgi:hypothetical protein